MGAVRGAKVPRPAPETGAGAIRPGNPTGSTPDAARGHVLHGLARSEHEEQADVIAWARLREAAWPWLALLYAVPNFARVSKQYGARMAREGKKAGVPDLCLPAPRGGYAGLYVEMKRADGSLPDVSDEQRAWIAGLKEQGYATAVAFGAQAGIELLAAYCRLPATTLGGWKDWPHPNTEFPVRRRRGANIGPDGVPCPY